MLEELQAAAFSDVRELFDATRRVKNIRDLDAHTATAVAASKSAAHDAECRGRIRAQHPLVSELGRHITLFSVTRSAPSAGWLPLANVIAINYHVSDTMLPYMPVGS